MRKTEQLRAGLRPVTDPYRNRPEKGLAARLICSLAGGVAQLAERYVRNVEAVGSSPITSTGGVRERTPGMFMKPTDRAGE